MTLHWWNFGKKAWTNRVGTAREFYLMSSALSVWKRFAFSGLFAGIATAVLAQNTYAPQGGEYPIAGYLPGDQVYPQISLGANGGYVVWQDNVTDGDGFGISAHRINANGLPYFGVFRVNEQGPGDQENVRVGPLKDGGAVFVWQGGSPGFQHVYARFLKGDGTFATGDRLVNTYTNNHQIDPSIAVLSDGNVVVTWSSYGQNGALYGVYVQVFSPAGDKVGSEIQVNQSTTVSQRSPSAAALPDGGFALVWVGERPSTAPIIQAGLIVVTNSLPRYTADIFGRRFNLDGSPRGDEFRVSSGNDPCANPAIAVSASGAFAVSWSQKDTMTKSNSWDVFARCFHADATPANSDERVNTYTYSEQYAPKICSEGSDYLVVWTSFGQDGAREGVYGQFLSGAGNLIGGELRVNTTTASRQIHPAVVSDGGGHFLVVWSSFIGGVSSFDLLAQRFGIAAQPLQSMSAPFVYAPFVVDTSATYQPQLLVSWPALEGLPVTAYEVYVDGSTTPAATITSNTWTLTGLAPSSTHSFQVDYVATDGRRSALSPAASGATWSGANYGGVPFEWMTTYFGPNVLTWPRPADDSDGDGASNAQEFLAGTVPTDPNSVLQTQIITTSQGTRLSWNCKPGSIYQVQASSTLEAGSWVNFGVPRFAAGTTDSILANGNASAGYYRVIRLR